MGPGRGPKIIKKASFCKKGASKHDIYVIFVESAVFLDFGFDFGSIFHQNSMCFFDVFALPLAFFLNAATFTIVCVLQCFEQFLLFSLFEFLPRNVEKNDQNMKSRKMIKNDHQGGPRIHENRPIWEQKSMKIAKIVEK